MGNTLAPSGPARPFDVLLTQFEAAPEALSSAHWAELQALLKEQDPELLREGLSSLASRLERAGKAESAAQIYNAILNDLPEDGSADLRTRAQSRLEGIQGQGDFGGRAEFLLSRFTKDAFDPKIILPMMLGTSVYSLTRTAVLGRFGTSALFRAVGPRFAASSLGFAAEVPAFALSARALRSASNHEPSVGQELAGAAITLGFLKTFGHIGQTLGATPALRSPSRFQQQLFSQTAMFGGLMTAHKVEETLGLRLHVDGATTVTDILASMLSLGLGASLAHRVMGPRYVGFHSELNWRSKNYSPGSQLQLESPFTLQPMMMAAGGGGNPNRPIEGFQGGSLKTAPKAAKSLWIERIMEISQGHISRQEAEALFAEGHKEALEALMSKLDRISLDKIDMKIEERSALLRAGVRNLREFLELDTAGILRIPNLDLKRVQGFQVWISDWLGIPGLPHEEPTQAKVDWRRVSLARIGLNADDVESLEKIGIGDVGDLLKMRLPNLLGKGGIEYSRWIGIRDQLRLFNLDVKFDRDPRRWLQVDLGNLGIPPSIVELAKQAGATNLKELAELKIFSSYDRILIRDHLKTEFKLKDRFNLVEWDSFEHAGFSPMLKKALEAEGYRGTWHIARYGAENPAYWLAKPSMNWQLYCELRAKIPWGFRVKGAAQWGKVPIEKMQFSPESTEALRFAGIDHVSDLQSKKWADLFNIPGLSREEVLELKARLEIAGIVIGSRDFGESKVPLEKLRLPEKTEEALRKAGIMSVGDLKSAKGSEFLQNTTLNWVEIRNLEESLTAFGLPLEDSIRPYDRLPAMSPSRFPFSSEVLSILEKMRIRELNQLEGSSPGYALFNAYFALKGGVTLPEIWKVQDEILNLGFPCFVTIPDIEDAYRLPAEKWAPPAAQEKLARDGIHTLGDLLKINKTDLAKREYFAASDLDRLLRAVEKL